MVFLAEKRGRLDGLTAQWLVPEVGCFVFTGEVLVERATPEALAPRYEGKQGEEEGVKEVK